jgi:hypothetical protein
MTLVEQAERLGIAAGLPGEGFVVQPLDRWFSVRHLGLSG